jgi:two-component system chemotaxis sensor kinase CheA
VAALSGLDPGQPAQAASGRALDLEPELLAKLTASDREQLAGAAASGRRAVRLAFVPSPERAARGLTITTVRERLGRLGDIVRVLPRSLPRSDEAPGGLAFDLLVVSGADDAALAEAIDGVPGEVRELEPGAAPAPGPAVEEDDAAPSPEEGPARTSYVRVEVARLDDVLERLSALVVTRFRLLRAVAALRARGVEVRELTAILDETGRQLRDLRASIMRARLVRVAELLERVPLLVRGLGQRTGKPARVEVQAGRAELDKAVAERLSPAVMHLVRNAVDHALEPPDERRRLGKPAEGLIRVVAAQRADNHLELSVSDDGRGVDAEAVARRAGVPVPEDAAALLDLLCRPGLSTQEQVSDTSWRGMGMDIVRRTIDGLGGELRLSTAAGAGTTFTVRVPLSISILDAFTVEAGGERFVVPVAGVEEIVALDEVGRLTAPGAAGGVRLLERRGEVMPLVALGAVLGRPAEGDPARALVVRRGAPAAVGVDRVVAQQEVVLRPLEDPLVRVRGVAGTTDLGDGRPTLVLDLPALVAGGAPTTGGRDRQEAA